jgi:hypothetical protein
MIKKIMVILLFLAIAFPCHSRDPETGYGTIIAIEFRSNNKFNHAVGKLEYTGQSIDIVGFSKGIISEEIIPTVQVYIISEKKIIQQGVHHIKGLNQYGVVASGKINFKDEDKPLITLITDGGTVITNLSTEGLNWKEKHISNLAIGF